MARRPRSKRESAPAAASLADVSTLAPGESIQFGPVSVGDIVLVRHGPAEHAAIVTAVHDDASVDAFVMPANDEPHNVRRIDPDGAVASVTWRHKPDVVGVDVVANESDSPPPPSTA
jgi:hypothetical protein